MDRSAVTRRVWELAEPLVLATGLELVDVQYRPEAGRQVLRLLIDRVPPPGDPPAGVTLDELARVSRGLGDVLDAHDAVPGRYQLECSSPGLNRPLIRPAHYERAVGRQVRVRTHERVGDRRQFRGTLAAVGPDGVTVCDPDAGEVFLPFAAIERANLEYDFARPGPSHPRGQEGRCFRDLNRVIEQVSKEKGIDREIIVHALEDAMLSAAKKTFGLEKNIEAKFNPELGEVELFEIKTVVDTIEDPLNHVTLADARRDLDPDAEVGDQLLAKLPPEKFGRIAAQAAKQNIIQRVRDAERDIIYNEFKGRKGELFSGIVQRFEKKNIIVNLGRTDAILPEKEQIPRERYRQGDRIRAFILDVELTSKGPQIVLSRTHPGLLIELFRQEVPEIYEGIVEVKGAAREPGGRAKIAVTSNDRDVDPVGACVGMRGTRVQAVVQELRGEKIDIVPWTGDPAEYVCRALAPAKVSKIIMDEDEHAMEVIVPDDQLSLAIGKKGQNVRLASRLSTWKLDVRSESEAEDEARRARASLTAVTGISDMTAELLIQDGIKSAEQLAETDVDTIADVDGIGPERAPGLVSAAREHVARVRADEEAALAAASEAAGGEELPPPAGDAANEQERG